MVLAVLYANGVKEAYQGLPGDKVTLRGAIAYSVKAVEDPMTCIGILEAVFDYE